MSSLAPSGRPGHLASLALMAGPRYGEELPVPSPVVTVGRAAGCDVVVDDDSVSAQHARLEYDLGAWRITDLQSINGTAVEGVKLAPNVPTPLPYGATVRLGGVQLQFREAEGADVESAKAGYVAPEAPRTLREERSGARFPLWLVLLILILAAVIGMIIYTNYARSTGTVMNVDHPAATALLALAAAP
ncbi:FHA domain-containing protein [Longimicrobium sp.]|uniref:FHA domain-containing protein n=1 Tax=Longimicrobium sp. TaxID=2029185 RepID=UPI002E355177|nr:FHA domain-containing protein [Longimicrobium sp.]HEX6040152.1 FHA domain-containing protein [Longimicrobium sp.]